MISIIWLISAFSFLLSYHGEKPRPKPLLEPSKCRYVFGDAARLWGLYKKIPSWNTTKVFVVDDTCMYGAFGVTAYTGQLSEKRQFVNVEIITIFKYQQRYPNIGHPRLYDRAGCYMGNPA